MIICLLQISTCGGLTYLEKEVDRLQSDIAENGVLSRRPEKKTNRRIQKYFFNLKNQQTWEIYFM